MQVKWFLKTCEKKINESKIIIFILSADFFMNPELLKMVDMVRIIHDKGNAVEVYSIYGKYCDWNNHEFIKNNRILPHTENPIFSETWKSKD